MHKSPLSRPVQLPVAITFNDLLESNHIWMTHLLTTMTIRLPLQRWNKLDIWEMAVAHKAWTGVQAVAMRCALWL